MNNKNPSQCPLDNFKFQNEYARAARLLFCIPHGGTIYTIIHHIQSRCLSVAICEPFEIPSVSGDFGYMANNTNCERGKWIYRNCKHLDRSLSVNQADKPSVLYRVCPVLPMGVYIVHTLLALQSEAFYCFLFVEKL